MEKYKNNTKINGEIIFLLIIIAIVYLINQFTKKEDAVESINNQIEIKMEYKSLELPRFDSSKFLFYLSTYEGKVSIQKILIDDLRNKYCSKIKSDDTYKDQIVVHRFNPFIVECKLNKNDELIRHLISNNWTYSLSLFNNVVGSGGGYLILSNKKIIEMETGKVISDNLIYNYYKNNYKEHISEHFNKATQYSRKMFFIYNDFNSINSQELNTIFLIDNGINKIKLVKLLQVQGIPKSNIYVKDMLVSKNGEYLYLLASIQRRGGEQNLRFIVVDIRTKSIVFIKTLSENKGFQQIRFQELNEKIAIIFISKSSKLEIYSFNNHVKSL